MSHSLQIFLSDRTDHFYDGSQLRPHWIYENFDKLGDCLVAFVGPSQVTIESMVDLEDVKANAPIAGEKMLHFIGEWFDPSLEKAVFRQHLLVADIYELLLERGLGHLSKDGDDIFFQGRKLSVSIATNSLVSGLVHTALNVTSEGTPLSTSCLNELAVEPMEFAKQVLQRFQYNERARLLARSKVRPR